MEAFIQQHGVTKCPSFGTPEFREMNLAREQARAQKASWEAKRRWRSKR